MATTFKWDAPATPTTFLNTELDTLLDGSCSAASTAFDNGDASARFQWAQADLTLTLAATTSLANPSVELYIVYSLDGFNFESGGGSVAPSLGSLARVIPIRNTTSSQWRVPRPIPIYPYPFKLILKNAIGQTLVGSGGNALRLGLFNEAT
ncbi:MAG: hypothetical protein NTW19_15415 [Planctomycetota bacterium]|nr:hypothetical protein [Planctomycetota bacterium]